MTGNLQSNIVKCDHKVNNITATFGADLVLEGFTSIPSILIKIYSRIGITDFQMMLLIHLIRFKVEEKNYHPSPEAIAKVMESNTAKIEKELADLLEKEAIIVSEYYDKKNNVIFTGYDFAPLFLKVSDVWATTRAREIVESEDLIKAVSLENGFLKGKLSDKLTGLISIFEREFGRPLSPFEVDQIQIWSEETAPQLVIEALKRAVLLSKHNFKYINGILMEWKKNNLQTLEDVARYDKDFLRRRAAGGSSKSQQGAAKNPTISGKDSKEKAFIRSLYNKA